MDVSLGQALAWRLERQFLLAGAGSVGEVVRRLSAVPAWSGDPELAVRRRLAEPSATAVADALESGDLIKNYAFRGATQLMAAEDAGIYLAIRCANRQWELKSWQQYYELGPDDWPALREVVRNAVVDGPISHSELIDKIAKKPRFRHLRDGLADQSHTLLKPFGWQGDMCFGPSRDGQATFQSPSTSPRWTGLPELDDAGKQAIVNYLAAYGPAPRDNIHYWLTKCLSAGRKRVDRWIGELVGDPVIEIQVDGAPMLHLRDQVDSLTATDPLPDQVTLLPGYDQWVLGPGTKDDRIVPTEHRLAVTRGANVVLLGGQVAGIWKLDKTALTVSWFANGRPPKAQVEAEIARLSSLLDRALTLTVL
jgi:winged helix DNA-binding protein